MKKSIPYCPLTSKSVFICKPCFSLLIQTKWHSHWKKAIVWIEKSYFIKKQWFEVNNINNNLDELFLINMQLFSSRDVNWWTGVVWITCGLLWCFYQLFGLSFWRHPFSAEHPLMSKWCNATFLQIWWRNNESWMAWGSPVSRLVWIRREICTNQAAFTN